LIDVIHIYIAQISISSLNNDIVQYQILCNNIDHLETASLSLPANNY